MIKTPVSYDDSETVLYPYPQVEDASGSFIFECKDKQVAQEIVKRINMHDELVAKLKECTNELISCIRERNKFINEPDGDFFDYQAVHECYELCWSVANDHRLR